MKTVHRQVHPSARPSLYLLRHPCWLLWDNTWYTVSRFAANTLEVITATVQRFPTYSNTTPGRHTAAEKTCHPLGRWSWGIGRIPANITHYINNRCITLNINSMLIGGILSHFRHLWLDVCLNWGHCNVLQALSRYGWYKVEIVRLILLVLQVL